MQAVLSLQSLYSPSSFVASKHVSVSAGPLLIYVCACLLSTPFSRRSALVNRELTTSRIRPNIKLFKGIKGRKHL